MLNVGARFGKTKGPQLVSGGDSSSDLPRVGMREDLIQIRLSDQNDTQQFDLVRFQVSQKPDQFHGLESEILCFADQYDGSPAARVCISEMFTEQIDENVQVDTLRRIRDVQSIADAGQKPGSVGDWVENQGDVDGVRQLFEQTPA